jgi:hypothetical protein
MRLSSSDQRFRSNAHTLARVAGRGYLAMTCVVLVTACAALSSAAAPTGSVDGWARWNALRGDHYVLDDAPRFIEEAGTPLKCNPEQMHEYRGSTIRYYGPVRVSEPFRERLERFEKIAAEVAVEVYGRAPSRIRHFGAYSCRPSRNRSERLSEHALGNAIDIVGFDFAPATNKQPQPAELPKALRRGFQVRVAKHWAEPTSESAAAHRRFLHLLTQRLHERRDVFRSMIGPGHGGHDDHFHFDVSPWRYVDL